MKLFDYLKALVINNLNKENQDDIPVNQSKEIPKEISFPQKTESKEFTEPLLTMSQAARKNGITRQAIFFAIKMKRLDAKKENGTWLISESALKEYSEKKYCRSKSRKEGELIFDKQKGFYSITEAAKILNKNVNHIYYLVRMGKLKTHRQGSAIVIEDKELHNYVEFIGQKLDKNKSLA
jgi:excisionase family DNA binding protein